jgi:hypothetical protein
MGAEVALSQQANIPHPIQWKSHVTNDCCVHRCVRCTVLVSISCRNCLYDFWRRRNNLGDESLKIFRQELCT